MNAGYYIARWVLSKSKSGAISTMSGALGAAGAHKLVTYIFSKGSAWAAAKYTAGFAGKLAAAGGPLGAVIGIAVGAL